MSLTESTTKGATGQTRTNPRTGKPYYSKDKREAVQARDAKRMYVNGKEVSKHHPLHKPGRYKSWEEVHNHQAINAFKEGYVYVIRNPAWPDWVKVGMALDYKDRCKGYQTSSPFRDYEIVHAVATNDKRALEVLAHTLIEQFSIDRRGEWFMIDALDAAALLQQLSTEVIDAKNTTH